MTHPTGEQAHFRIIPSWRCIKFDAAESRGACWARREAQGVYGGEDFLLQIDSHMRAVEHWDDLLADDLEGMQR